MGLAAKTAARQNQENLTKQTLNCGHKLVENKILTNKLTLGSGVSSVQKRSSVAAAAATTAAAVLCDRLVKN